MPPQKNAAKADEKKAPVPYVKTPLEKEIERVSNAAGLPIASVTAMIADEKKKIDNDRKAALEDLKNRVSSVVATSLQEKAAKASAALTAPAQA